MRVKNLKFPKLKNKFVEQVVNEKIMEKNEKPI